MTSWISPDLFAPKDHRPWPLDPLEPQAYSLIMADPPWRFELYSELGEEKSAEAQYQTMSLDDIGALPVGDLARADCLLWLWATAPLLPQALGVMRTWGFEYVTSGAWVKRTVNGKMRWGTGYRLRSCHEPFLIGVRGEPKTKRDVPSVIDGLAREHSRKPDSAYTWAERMLIETDVRRADVFSRERRAGWESFGNEADKFDGEKA